MGEKKLRVGLTGALIAVIAVLATACGPQPGGGGGGNGSGPVDISPIATDPAIQVDPLAPTFAIRPTGTPRNQLVVLFNGTGAYPKVLSTLGGKLAADGYHVIGLRYASATATQAACPDSLLATAPECHRTYRSEVVFGAGVADPTGAAYDNPAVNVTKANSVANRLIKAVDYLRERYPLNGWETYQQRLDGDCSAVSATYGGCELDWSKIVTMGHSQGAGVALYLAKFFPLARVAMLSGAYDAFYDSDSSSFTVAPWITEGDFQVPVDRMAAFSHLSDPGLAIQRAVANGLGLAGPEQNVTTTARPYSNSHRLVTNVTPSCFLDTSGAHSATATDACSPPNVHVDAWRYLAGGV